MLLPHAEIHSPAKPRLSVLWSNKVSHGDGLGGLGMVLIMSACVFIMMSIICRSNVFHLVDRAALWAALNIASSGDCEPDDNVRVGRMACAADVLLVAI